MERSNQLFERAKKVIPGGVNSPVRAFQSVGGNPRFIKSASGSHIVDVDGQEYIDYIGSWGPMILGHSNPKILEAISNTMANGISFGAATEIEVLMAELISSLVPSVEMIRMVNSGTEAVMSAIRAARGFTNREKIIKFVGCYHGHTDSMLVKAGSGALAIGTPNSGGVTVGTAKDTLLAQYNDIESVRLLFDKYPGQIAALIVEPIAANMGVVLPKDGFLAELRSLCTKNDVVLIFDEVITGFRLAVGGAQEYFGVTADLVTYGKIIGGGMPVGAYGGRRDIMECIAPLGNIYQAGTLSGNPLAMAAGYAMLSVLSTNPKIYSNINRLGERLSSGLRSISGNTVNSIGSLTCMFMTNNAVVNFDTAMKSDTKAYAALFNSLLSKSVYIAPAQFEAMFISNAHTENDIDETLNKFEQALKEKK